MRYLLGTIAILLELFGTLILATLTIFLAILTKITPSASLKKYLQIWTEQPVALWGHMNHFIFHQLLNVDIQIMGQELLTPGKNYFVIANHQSWIDIFMMEEALLGQSGTPKYFIKKNLVYLPIFGLAMQALRYPVMNRFTKEYLAKHPEDKGKDIESTRRACQALHGSYFKLTSYPEGTRFTSVKHTLQQSPYRYLLKPKAGGIAYALDILHDQLDSILNLTIVYDQKPNLFHFFFGKIKKVIIIIEKMPITPDLIGNYEEDKTFRIHFQRFMNNLWQKKDQQIHRLKSL